MTDMDESKEAQRAGEAKAELTEILEARPDLKGKSIEAVRRVLRREARLSLRPRRTPKNTNVNPQGKREAEEGLGEMTHLERSVQRKC
jgi:hypothetical protein